MLKLKYLAENADLARMALDGWRHDEAAPEQLLQDVRRASNMAYPYEHEGKRYFLRMSPAEETTLPLLREELRFVSLIRETGYPAPAPVPSRNGEYLRDLRTPWGVWYACAFEEAPGVPLSQLEWTEEIAASWGVALGALHHASMEILIPPARPNFLSLLRGASDILEDAPYTLYRECRDVRDELQKLPRGVFRFGMIHGDFRPDNAFWDGEKCHVGGFDDCMVHFYALDVVTALDALPVQLQADFLRGYRSACPESGVREEEFPLMRRFRDVYQYARIMRALSERPEPESAWAAEMASRLTEEMQAIEMRVARDRKARKRQLLTGRC